MKVVQIIPLERILLRIVEQIFDVPVPLVFVGFLEVIQVIHNRSGCRSSSWSRLSMCPFRKYWRTSLKLCDYFLRIQHRTVGETADVPVPLFQEQTAEVIKVIHRCGCQNGS